MAVTRNDPFVDQRIEKQDILKYITTEIHLIYIYTYIYMYILYIQGIRGKSIFGCIVVPVVGQEMITDKINVSSNFPA